MTLLVFFTTLDWHFGPSDPMRNLFVLKTTLPLRETLFRQHFQFDSAVYPLDLLPLSCDCIHKRLRGTAPFYVSATSFLGLLLHNQAQCSYTEWIAPSLIQGGFHPRRSVPELFRLHPRTFAFPILIRPELNPALVRSEI